MSYNLLPWRSIRRQKKQKVIGTTVVLLWLGCIGAMMALKYELHNRINRQVLHNQMLLMSVIQHQTLLKEGQSLTRTKELLQKHVTPIHHRQIAMQSAINILGDLGRMIPDGVYLNHFTQRNGDIHISGYAENNVQLSQFITRLSHHCCVHTLTLTDLKKATLEKDMQNFQLHMISKACTSC